MVLLQGSWIYCSWWCVWGSFFFFSFWKIWLMLWLRMKCWTLYMIAGTVCSIKNQFLQHFILCCLVIYFLLVFWLFLFQEYMGLLLPYHPLTFPHRPVFQGWNLVVGIGENRLLIGLSFFLHSLWGKAFLSYIFGWYHIFVARWYLVYSHLRTKFWY